ncbi:MAG: aldehyde dehydrogenase family protein [Streptosporangiales bacterium]|nr:aldehyde dehydrogenase family protein [Streptosporangiales bacterium]
MKVETGDDVATEVTRAVDLAVAARSAWARTPMPERQAIVHRFGDLVAAHADAFTDTIVAEVGKLRADAAGEVDWTVLSAHWYADRPPRDRRVAGALVAHRPLGVVATITPWNVPLHTPAWKWLPALLAGNTVVWKPSELTPRTAVLAVELLREAGLPEGALTLATGSGAAGSALVDDERIAAVHFTGSTATGHAIAARLAPRGVRYALEMGGLNPAVVFADADLALAADCIVAAGIALNGQKCTCTRRVLAHASVADDLSGELARRISAVVPGDPSDPRTELAPLVTADAARRARLAVAAAVDRGARPLATSPEPDGRHDAFVPATLLADVAPDDPLRTRELFAPVLTFDTFADTEGAWRQADASDYGLSAAVFSHDDEVTASAPARLRAGVVNLNRRSDAVDLEAPFGGMKQSGNGHPEGGEFIYSSVTALQAVYGQVADPPGSAVPRETHTAE